MKYKLVEKGTPGKPTAPKKWYANPINSGTVDQKAIAKAIAGRSSLTAGDVANVIENFLEVLPSYLTDGKSVKLGDFGTFRLSISSEGAEKAEDFNAATQIKTVKTLFTPSTDFKKSLQDIHFEKG